MPEISIKAGTIYHEIVGQGPPVALLFPHSTGPGGRKKLIASLAEQHTVIIYDPLGTGRSSAATGSMSIDTQAGEVAELIDRLGFDKVSLLCHSTGTGIGISMTSQFPDRVQSLILASPWTHGDAYLTTIQNLRIAAANALNPERYSEFNAALLFPPEFRRANEAGFRQLTERAKIHPHDAAIIAQRLQEILAFDARPLLARIKCPTLVICGLDDQLMPPWFASEMAAGINGAESRTFETGGHMLPETVTTEFVALVNEFFSRSINN